MEMNTALVIIDIQNNYFEGGKMELYKPDDAAQKAQKMLELFRKEKLPVFHVQHMFTITEDAETVEELRAIHKIVEPADGEKVIVKYKPSSFLGTDLQLSLKEANVNKLVICGMMSHMCIDTTVRAAQDYGYEVVVLEDACTTKDLQTKHGMVSATVVHDVFMSALSGMFAKIMTVEEFVDEYNNNAV